MMSEKRTKLTLDSFQAIRIGAAILLYSICTALCGGADEKMPVLTVNKQVYSNVTITAVTATDIFFTYNKGAANAKLKNLDPELQKHFNYDAAAAQGANTEQMGSGGSSSSSTSTAPGAVQSIGRKNAPAIMADAIERVKRIVNQPVRALTRTPDMEVSTSSPGWFHQGAAKPDFATVDVRATQDTSKFAPRVYITSDLNPGVAFAGSEVEFNSMTKYFYVDRSLPKKKLTEAEMLEINRLYRIIGECEEKLQPPSMVALGFASAHKNILIAGAAGLAVLLLVVRIVGNRSLG